jgi:Uma2 family endonuclease
MAMPAPAREKPRHWTAREVRELIANNPLATPRYELVDGELLVTPSPGGAHQNAVGVLAALLREYLRRQRVGHVFVSPFDVELEPELIVQPDLFVVPMVEAKRLLTDAHARARELLLAVEVASPSSGRFDRVVKKPIYQRHVSEYWIVDFDSRLFERWQSGDARPQILIDRLEWRPTDAASSFVLDLSEYFAEVHGEST